MTGKPVRSWQIERGDAVPDGVSPDSLLWRFACVVFSVEPDLVRFSVEEWPGGHIEVITPGYPLPHPVTEELRRMMPLGAYVGFSARIADEESL